MEIRQISDDFFTSGHIAILNRKTGNNTYDFDFRTHFECRSVFPEVKEPVLLHIGAIPDYAGISALIKSLGMQLLVSEEEHLRCSTIEKWYPLLEDLTPFTRVYDILPSTEQLLKDFTFPVFIKGNRQTNRHRKSQCIIRNEDDYRKLQHTWKQDSVLSWQRPAIRNYVPLKTIDDSTFPEMVPISYEFRFFYVWNKCMVYGPYWTLGNAYTLASEEVEEAKKLTESVTKRINVPFLAIDIAKTASGQWIVIEVNDAQESGFVGVNPLTLWNNVITTFC